MSERVRGWLVWLVMVSIVMAVTDGILNSPILMALFAVAFFTFAAYGWVLILFGDRLEDE